MYKKNSFIDKTNSFIVTTGFILCIVLIFASGGRHRPSLRRITKALYRHIVWSPIDNLETVQAKQDATKENKQPYGREECNFQFNKRINRVFMVANNPNPSKSVIDFVNRTSLTDTDIVVRFNAGLHIDWWNGRTDLNFFRMHKRGYYGLPEGFSRHGLHCIVNKHPSVVYDGINGRLDMHKSTKITRKSPSTGFAAIVVARDNIPKSKIYLLGFTFHGFKSSRTHNFTDEAVIIPTFPNVINVGPNTP